MADGCVALCYARSGTYNFGNVKAAHQRNLKMILDHPEEWETAMRSELAHKRFRPNGVARLPELAEALSGDLWASEWTSTGGAAVRIHDAGDFFSDDYLAAWLRIAARFPDVLFYCYTKEVSRFRRLVEGKAPDNFRWCYSLGGKEDHLVDPEADRHADVFPNVEALHAAGYLDQSSNDLLAVLAPTLKVGIPANNIPAIRRRMGTDSFSAVQLRRDTLRSQRAVNRPTAANPSPGSRTTRTTD